MRDQFHPVRLIQRLACLGNHLIAEVGKGNMTLGPFDEGDTQFRFQILQGNAQSRLADMAALGGAANRPFIGKGNQIAKRGEFHRLIFIVEAYSWYSKKMIYKSLT